MSQWAEISLLSQQVTQQWEHLLFTTLTDSKNPSWTMNPRCSLWLQWLLYSCGSCQSWSQIQGEKFTLQLPKAPSHPLVYEKEVSFWHLESVSNAPFKERENRENEEEKEGDAAENLPSPLMEKCSAKSAICVFLSPLKEKAKPQLPMFSKWPTHTYKGSSAFLPPGKVFFN